MALNRTAAVARVRTLVAEITGMKRVYAPSETGDNALPPALNELPAALILPGPMTRNMVQSGGQRRDYEIRIQIFEAGADIGSRAFNVLPFADLICDKFISNVALGGRVNSCLVDRDSGFVGLEYGGKEYTGYEIILRVSEEGAAAPETGV